MIKLNAKLREKIGAGFPRRLRKDNKIPATLYGSNSPKSIYVDYAEFSKNIVFPKEHEVFELVVDSDKPVKVLIKDYQYNIIKNKVEHLDFFEVKKDKKIIVKVPVKFVGIAEGIKAGGNLFIIKRKVKIKCLYEKIPSVIEIPIDDLKIGVYVRSSTINLSDDIEILEDKKQVLATITGKPKND